MALNEEVNGEGINIRILLKNGYIVNFDGKFHGDILVEDGQIIKVGRNITEQAESVIDAEGNYVFPGFIDSHTHIGCHKELGFSKETKAAKLGGTTTIFDFVYPKKGERLITALNSKRSQYEGIDNCKVELHVVISEFTEDMYEQLKEIKRAGVRGVKVYTTHDINKAKQ